MEQKTIKQDINFLEYPLWQIGKKDIDEVYRWTDRDGYGFEARKGVSNKVDILFLYYFMLKAQNDNWNNTLVLTRYEILKACGITPCKDKHKRLEESLEKWINFEIFFSGLFCDDVTYEKLSFGVINGWELREEDKKLEITFNENWILKIKRSVFFKYIDFEEIRKIKTPLAFRLYEILCENLHDQKLWEIDILKLAEKIPMAEKQTSHIIPRIESATKRIRDKTRLNVLIITVKQGRNKGAFIFKKLPKKIIKQKINPAWEKVSKEDTEKIMTYFGANPFESHEECSKQLNIAVETINYCIAWRLKSQMKC